MPPTAASEQPTTTGEIATTGSRNHWRWFLFAAIVLLLVLFYALGLHRYVAWETIRANLESWQRQVRANLLVALLVFFLGYTVITALSLPAAAALTMLAGALFGRWLGTGLVSLAATSGATLAFLLSRYLLHDWVQQRFGKRLEPINSGVARDGGYYLFTLRLIPAIPFFLINLGMALTPMRVGTFALVSWAGMLMGTFLYVNAGTALATLDSPSDVLSPGIIASLAALGVVPLLIRKLLQWQVRLRHVVYAVAGLLVMAVLAIGVRTYFRYATAETMEIAVQEFSNAEYSEDPSGRSVHHGQYDGRTLTLVKKDDTHFDFIFEPQHEHISRIVFRDVDVSLMTPSLPEWTKTHDGLTRIALTDRQWNRQQVRFGGPESPQVEVEGGDGFERERLYSAELAKNCLNAGLWEVLLFVKENGKKAMYYQGWFTFPHGHYMDIFEQQTGLPYWQHWYYLEHWFDPAGTVMDLDQLREVRAEREVPATFDKHERVIFHGEQVRKTRTTMADNVRNWGDFYNGKHIIRFGSFIPPGRYSNDHPWKNRYTEMDRFDRAILRKVQSPGSAEPLDELELIFSSSNHAGLRRFILSGLDFAKIPQLPIANYPKSVYMPMGIGVPPFYQSYEQLQQKPPQKSPYFSFLLDEDDAWIDHHSFAIDGPVMHRDAADPLKLHLYLLSYERHTLVAHLVIDLHHGAAAAE